MTHGMAGPANSWAAKERWMDPRANRTSLLCHLVTGGAIDCASSAALVPSRKKDPTKAQSKLAPAGRMNQHCVPSQCPVCASNRQTSCRSTEQSREVASLDIAWNAISTVMLRIER